MPTPDPLQTTKPRSLKPVEIPASAKPDPDQTFTLLVAVIVIAALYLARDVLIPITVAGLLSFLLAPLVALLRKTGIGRIASVLAAALLALGVLLVIGAVIGTQIAHLLEQLPQYIATVQQKVSAVGAYLTANFADFFSRLGLAGILGSPSDPAISQDPVAGPAAGGASSSATDISASALGPMALLSYLSPILSPFVTAGIIFVVAIFFLIQQEDLRDRVIRLFGSSDLHRTTGAMDDAARRLSRYFLTLLAINVGDGVVIGIGLYFIGVPNPVLWGILATVLRFVPYVGPVLSAGLPIALAAAVDPGWSMVLSTIALFIVVELVFNQVVEPVSYGTSTGLSTFAVIVAALFWGWLWGPIGLILSMPLTLCLVVIGRHVERLEFFDILLGDRPALTPVESFYQRMLAGDADEAQDHAETILEQRALSTYYDEVALKGLQLAANDLQRGVLRPDQLERIQETVSELVAALDVYGDVAPETEIPANQPSPAPKDAREITYAPPPQSIDPETVDPIWRGEAPALCVAGRGPLDEATSTMLVQLLGKHGIAGRVASFEDASRTGIERLDLSGVAMICISYLDLTGSPSHLRYLVRRLRAKAPGIPILVGLWPADDKTLTDAQIQKQIGADHFTTSLRDAVDVCVEVARSTASNARAADAVQAETSSVA